MVWGVVVVLVEEEREWSWDDVRKGGKYSGSVVAGLVGVPGKGDDPHVWVKEEVGQVVHYLFFMLLSVDDEEGVGRNRLVDY